MGLTILETMRGIRFITLPLVMVVLLSMTAGCRQGSRGAERLAEDSSAAEDLDSNLVFENLTLEQANEQGETLWNVKAEKVVYSPDQKTATVTNPDGELYQDGESVYRIQAQSGEIRRDGDRIFLRGGVVATDLKSGAILRGNQLEWQPQSDLLIVRGNVQGTHPDFQFSANEARASNKKRQIEVSGQINARTLEDPTLRLQGEQIVWRVDDEKVLSNRPIQVQRVQGEQVLDQANGNQGDVNLQTRVVLLRNNAVLTLTDPPLQITGNLLQWNVNQQTLVSDQPLTVVHQQEQIVLTADRGRMEFEPKIAYFNGNVRAVEQADQAQLTANALTWNVNTQQVEAEGNVVYVQPDPPATLRGPRAVGKLKDQTIVVSGGRVETQIVPQEIN
ncbi:MAG: hypothetical protein Kow00121_15760 [Elainellaceae cyanobacterium]